jgi:hypothetical protein
MSLTDAYIDYRGYGIDTSSLDDEERKLIEELHRYAKDHPDVRTTEYWNFYIKRVAEFYEQRGLTRRETTRTAVWRIAQDLRSRQLIAAGMAGPGDYRDDLERLILTKFNTRRAFCEATGLSEDMLSHVLAKRKDYGLQTLSEALAKVGFELRIAPLPMPSLD